MTTWLLKRLFSWTWLRDKLLKKALPIILDKILDGLDWLAGKSTTDIDDAIVHELRVYKQVFVRSLESAIYGTVNNYNALIGVALDTFILAVEKLSQKTSNTFDDKLVAEIKKNRNNILDFVMSVL